MPSAVEYLPEAGTTGLASRLFVRFPIDEVHSSQPVRSRSSGAFLQTIINSLPMYRIVGNLSATLVSFSALAKCVLRLSISSPAALQCVLRQMKLLPNRVSLPQNSGY